MTVYESLIGAAAPRFRSRGRDHDDDHPGPIIQRRGNDDYHQT